MYTIEVEHHGKRVAIPIAFWDREEALANAQALRKSGFRVLRVIGPGFELKASELAEHAPDAVRHAARARSLP
jgi:hypothetical protein